MKHLLIAAAICMAATGAMAQGHEGHNHGTMQAPAAGQGHDGHSHGTPQDLGTTAVAGLNLRAYQFGHVSDAYFEVLLATGSVEPVAIRAWVGVESADGSVKTKADKSATGYQIHTELPNPMPRNSMLWVEVQPANGKKAKAAFALKP